jgi:hypothetical protein
LKYVLLAVVVLGLTAVHPLVAQQTAQDIDAKLKQIDAKIDELEQLKTDLEGLRDDLKAGPPEAKPGWEDKVKINGYVQQRYIYRDWGEDEFWFRRMYINLIVTPNDRTTAVVTWARIGPDPQGLTNTDWANVFVDYKINDSLTARVGQGPDWFGLETAQSSGSRLAMERAAVLEGGQGKPLGLYFAGPWDRGVWLVRNATSDEWWEPQAIFGVINGQFRATEKDNNKTISLDLKWKPEWGEFGASWLNGWWTNDLGLPFAAGTTQRSALLGYVRWDPDWCKFAVQGEYVDGKLLGSDIDGWYAQLEYDPVPDGTAFVKYEKFDPAHGVPANHYDAWHFGYAHSLDKSNKLTVQYSAGDNRQAAPGTTSRDELAVQWQFGF